MATVLIFIVSKNLDKGTGEEVSFKMIYTIIPMFDNIILW